ncbi:MAG: UbiA family prenyltransferase, partial [Desulfurococcaceae archaeon]
AVVGIAYSFLRRHWWSHFLVAFSTTGPVIYGYVATGLPARDLYFTVLFSFTIFTVTLGREFLKAIQDVEGDRIHSYRTIATALGVEKASRATLFVSLIGSILGLATTTLSAGGVYKVLITIASILYSYSMFRALTRLSDREVLEGTRRKTLQAMALGMAAFWLSKLP